MQHSSQSKQAKKHKPDADMLARKLLQVQKHVVVKCAVQHQPSDGTDTSAVKIDLAGLLMNVLISTFLQSWLLSKCMQCPSAEF